MEKNADCRNWRNFTPGEIGEILPLAKFSRYTVLSGYLNCRCLSMQVGVRPQSGNYYAICDMLYKLCLSSTFRDSTCHMEGVTIFKVNLNLCVYHGVR